MKLLERADLICRRRGMSGKTARVYCHWIRRYLAFCAAAHGDWVGPEQLGTADVEAFLNHLVGERRLAASTQNQALAALLFLYRRVLEQPIETFQDFARAKRPERLPAVLTPGEVVAVLDRMSGPTWLMASLADPRRGDWTDQSNDSWARPGRARCIVHAGGLGASARRRPEPEILTQRRRDAEAQKGKELMNENEIAKIVVDAAIEVHRTLGGPGCLRPCTKRRSPSNLNRAG